MNLNNHIFLLLLPLLAKRGDLLSLHAVKRKRVGVWGYFAPPTAVKLLLQQQRKMITAASAAAKLQRKSG
jgi:hypothetical protein